uniref:(California timema) hypothetical protein n=1 Tax=Timema californicum TaxID=61474 RepID=A0A7R9J261_TIMCA|nr:unnamed protein product [Timema californicum]
MRTGMLFQNYGVLPHGVFTELGCCSKTTGSCRTACLQVVSGLFKSISRLSKAAITEGITLSGELLPEITEDKPVINNQSSRVVFVVVFLDMCVYLLYISMCQTNAKENRNVFCSDFGPLLETCLATSI